MKKIIILLLLGIIINGCKQSGRSSQTVNSKLGDKSFIEKFGVAPNQSTDENLRIKTHLEYVERLLRSVNTDHLSSKLNSSRKFLLDKLHEYWSAEQFPKNYDYINERKPCFIDKDGNICAVGYLIEQTSGRSISELINQRYKYHKIFDMQMTEVKEWIKNSGLTLEECAMIQPAYPPQYPNNNNYIPTGYGVGSSILGGINFSISALNFVQIYKGTNDKVIPALGLLSGAGSIALGLANLSNDEILNYWGYPSTNEYKKTLSFLNIGIGTATIFLSTANLVINKPKKDKQLSWNIYSSADENDSFGIRVIKRF